MTGFVYVPLAGVLVVLVGHGVGLRRSRRKAEAFRDEARTVEFLNQLRHMREWGDITGADIIAPVKASPLLAEVMPAPARRERRPRRVSTLRIVWAELTLAAVELVVDVAAWWHARRAKPVDPRVHETTESVVRVVSDTIVSHRAPEPSRSAVRWAELRAWPLEPADDFERWWRTTHHVAKRALRQALGASAQRARWNASTGAWAAVRLIRLDDTAALRITPSPAMGLRLRPIPTREHARELVSVGGAR